jgi:Cofilin/tropomyosin-type actin-binding protein
MIDKQTKEIRQDDEKTVYQTLDDIAEDLPDHSPRFVLLSYPLTLVSLPIQSTPWIQWGEI